MLDLGLDLFAPVFALLALGAWLRRGLLPDPAIWAGMERLIFFVLLPALLVGAIAAVDLARLPIGGMAGAIWATLLAGGALALALARAFRLDHAAMTSALQGGVRFNNFLGFALVAGAFGPPGLALGAVATGLIVPFVQVQVALAFALGGAAPRPGRVLGALARNPLLLACLAGFAAAALGGLPPGLGPTLRLLGSAAVALGLLCVGAALTPGALGAKPGPQAAVAALKLIVVPALTLLLGTALGLDRVPLGVAVLFMALPTATTSYVMARALGGDAPLMAAMISTQHLLSVVTLPLWILALTR